MRCPLLSKGKPLGTQETPKQEQEAATESCFSMTALLSVGHSLRDVKGGTALIYYESSDDYTSMSVVANSSRQTTYHNTAVKVLKSIILI